ncbi:replication initiator protein A [Epibacterium ulvae]|uniref:replication initiator protein A n=1 Tax=Epibacterium ulvae TaxID=1156985 RepID=UPI002492DACB|nr:replication initiator protein A [Epibacterium ulvae]
MSRYKMTQAGTGTGAVTRAGPGGDLPAHAQGDLSQGDFFLCDIFGAVPKNDLVSMEHPLFSLATRPDRRILQYEHNGAEITVTPSVKGLATIHDKDILIFCISQLMAALNAGRQVSRTLHLKAHDLLVATNRETSGDAYRRLREAFERLAGTRITTNIVTGGEEVTTGFGLIEKWQIVRKARGGRMVSVAVTLSEWLYRAVLSKSVLTLSRDYFSLRKPLERRIYELTRKHCGRQPEWSISVDTLLKKSGSASPRRVFRKMLRDMIAAETLPDYQMEELPGDIIRFSRKGVVLKPGQVVEGLPVLKSDTLEQARALFPGADVYALEADWRATWLRTGSPQLRSADAAFLGWVKKRSASGL